MPCKITKSFLTKHFYNPRNLVNFNPQHSKALMKYIEKKNLNIDEVIQTINNYGDEVGDTVSSFDGKSCHFQVEVDEDFDKDELMEIITEKLTTPKTAASWDVLILNQMKEKIRDGTIDLSIESGVYWFEKFRERILVDGIYTEVENIIGRDEYTHPACVALLSSHKKSAFIYLSEYILRQISGGNQAYRKVVTHYDGGVVFFNKIKYRIQSITDKKGIKIQSSFILSVLDKRHVIEKTIVKNIKNKKKQELLLPDLRAKKLLVENKVSTTKKKLQDINKNKYNMEIELKTTHNKLNKTSDLVKKQLFETKMSELSNKLSSMTITRTTLRSKLEDAIKEATKASGEVLKADTVVRNATENINTFSQKLKIQTNSYNIILNGLATALFQTKETVESRRGSK